MANIIRCKMPDGVHRFKPFTVADYRDFLLVRNDMVNKSEEEQITLLDEMLEDYFGDYPKSWRPYMFVQVFTGSIGKTKIPVMFECSKCKKNKQFLFNLSMDELKSPEIEVAGLKIRFDFPTEEIEDKTEMILSTIRTVEDENTNYNWTNLSEEEQTAVIDAIDIETLASLVKQMKPINFEFKYGCCVKHDAVYDRLIDIFKILLNPDEVFAFYQVNHLLVKNKYNLESIMQMIPIERSIALSLVEKDLK